ncbi:MAG: FmdB family zinc ribbon protein [Candidatus Promineifilaceae bacterium]
MPIFEFDCKNCGETFDKLVRSSSAISDVTCPSCSSPQVKKRLSLFSSRGSASSSAASSAASCAPGGL